MKNITFRGDRMAFFLEEEDRTINPFFTGRTDVQDWIDLNGRIVSQKYLEMKSTPPAAGISQLIQGPPGVGKTSLLEKISEDCIEQLNDKGSKHKTVPIFIPHPNALTDLNFRELIKKTIGDLNKRITLTKVKKKVGDSLDLISSVSILGTGLGKHQSTRPSEPIVPKNFTILLLVDEIQNISADTGREPIDMLRTFHGGSFGYPILPVLAGLSDSRIILQRYGISRFGINAENNLHPLSLAEIKESIEKFVDYFNIRTIPEITSNWGDRIGGWTDGWPKHLENTMKSLGEELLKTDGNLGTVSPNTVKRKAALIRADYYNTRFGPFYSIPRIIGEIMADIGPNPREGEEIRTIINKTLKKPNWVELVSDPDLPRLNFNFLLRYGLINITSDVASYEYNCPIPSLQSYSVAITGSHLHTSAYTGNKESLTRYLERSYDINGVDAWGRTPLHISAENNWVEATSLLLKEGASPNIRDNWNRLPLDLAKKGSYTHELIMKAANLRPTPSPDGDYDNDSSPSPDF